MLECWWGLARWQLVAASYRYATADVEQTLRPGTGIPQSLYATLHRASCSVLRSSTPASNSSTPSAKSRPSHPQRQIPASQWTSKNRHGLIPARPPLSRPPRASLLLPRQRHHRPRLRQRLDPRALLAASSPSPLSLKPLTIPSAL